MLKMEAVEWQMKLENGIQMPSVKPEDDWRPVKWEEETEEEKTERVNIAIKAKLKAMRDSVTKVKKAEDNNMRLVEALDLSLPLNSNNDQTSTDFCPIEFKSVSDLTLHMASFSLWEIPRHLSRERKCMRTHKLFPSSRDFLPFVRLPK